MKMLIYLCLLFLVFFISGIIGSFAWPYTLNAWLTIAGKVPSVVWWHGFLLGCVPGIGQLSVPFVILTWIIILFL